MRVLAVDEPGFGGGHLAVGGQPAAVVSRGGRPDLAGPHLRAVSQPTLLIVGALDAMVIELNRKALRKLTGEARLEVIAGASHLSPNQAPLNK